MRIVNCIKFSVWENENLMQFATGLRACAESR
jgi:hypothetical protein